MFKLRFKLYSVKFIYILFHVKKLVPVAKKVFKECKN